MRALLLVLCVVIMAGCAKSAIWVSDPVISEFENNDTKISLRPIHSDYYDEEYPGHDAYNRFILTVENKTDKVIELNWNKTNFISDGMSQGGFMLPAILFVDKDQPRQSDVVFAKSVLKKDIYPSSLAEFGKGWYNAPVVVGETGAFITLNIDGKEYQNKLTSKLRIITHIRCGSSIKSEDCLKNIEPISTTPPR